eukprot:CAMPEP_0119301158 /NCGR_PEP_ID=MMETSP1333-20130426/2983_1 /TAXON_ID=418940 /ORGANISM="Scyphosphaera apsteinii, Strain RCC1455" /LENGTH=37 /DNA_ID= /DNA_START= /DNA_END= /DNA_ORIENTATION=
MEAHRMKAHSRCYFVAGVGIGGVGIGDGGALGVAKAP